MESQLITRLNPVRDRRRRRVAAVAVAAVVVAMAIASTLLSPRSDTDTAERRTTDPAAEREAVTESEAQWDPAMAEPGSFRVTVDNALVPDQPFVDGVFEGDAPRPVGRLVGETGEHTDIVLGELVVTTTSDEELDAFVDRWDADIVQQIDPDRPGDPNETLVRVDPTNAPTDRLAEDLLEVEPHKGEMRVGDDAVHRLLAVMATEAAHHDLLVTPNWLQQGSTLVDGEAIEDNDHDSRNAFDWSYMSYDAPLRSGVGAAWQLLAVEDRLDNRVEVMVVDGGFVDNPDFPDNTTLRKGGWRHPNEGPCEGGSVCPYHATDVALTAVGQVDNHWGVAGTGGPVSDLIATGNHADDSWSLYRDIEDVVADERPDILNMSWIGEITVARIYSRDRVDRIFRRVQDKGALPFAGAGNSGKDLYGQSCFIGICWETVLQVPCESQHVVCVAGLKGGKGSDAVERDPGSNYSASDDRRSVEIWAHVCRGYRPTGGAAVAARRDGRSTGLRYQRFHSLCRGDRCAHQGRRSLALARGDPCPAPSHGAQRWRGRSLRHRLAAAGQRLRRRRRSAGRRSRWTQRHHRRAGAGRVIQPAALLRARGDPTELHGWGTPGHLGEQHRRQLGNKRS